MPPGATSGMAGTCPETWQLLGQPDGMLCAHWEMPAVCSGPAWPPKVWLQETPAFPGRLQNQATGRVTGLAFQF